MNVADVIQDLLINKVCEEIVDNMHKILMKDYWLPFDQDDPNKPRGFLDMTKIDDGESL